MRIGIDLGGTKIAGIALADDGRCLAERRTPTPWGDYDATLDTVIDMVHELEAATGATGTVGIGTPGAISPATGLIRNANSTFLNGRPMHADLQQRLGREIRMDNDANCFALSEAVDGAGQGMAVVFGVILGTGCGGGIVIDGRVVTGPHAIAGEWGHNPLPWPRPEEGPGPACFCGRNGCIETWVSGTGLARDHRETTGEDLACERIVARADAGDDRARATLERHEDRLARGLATVINLLDPDMIVLGGGLSGIRRLYDNVPRSWRQYVFSDRCDTRLRPPVHGAAGGARGAAWLWQRRI